METPPCKYLVVAVRKSDGQTFFPENRNHRKGIDDLNTALNIAKEKARNNSEDYWYVVYQCLPKWAVEKEPPTPPVKVYQF